MSQWSRPGEIPLVRPITGIPYRDGIRFDVTLSLPEFDLGEGVAFINNGNEFLVAPWGESDPELWVFMRNVDGTGNPDWRSTRQVSGGEVQDPYYVDMIEIAKRRLFESRVKIYRIGRDRLLDILTGRLVLDMGLLPDDATIVNLNADWSSQSIEFLVSSASYEVVPEGVLPPAEIGLRFFVARDRGDE